MSEESKCPKCGAKAIAEYKELTHYDCGAQVRGDRYSGSEECRCHQLASLTSERDRLKAALEKIEAVAAWPAADLPSNREHDLQSVFAIARAALEGSK